MDQHNLEIQYNNDLHHDKANMIKQLEEDRKLNGNIDRQRENLRDYLEYDNTRQAKAGIERLKNGKEVLKSSGASLSTMKSATERIYHKDKKDYVAKTTAGIQALKESYRRETGDDLSDTKARLAHEYKQLIENCRVFDNEVRETVETVLNNHPELLANYDNGNLKSRTVVLSRLVTAFLPEREFHFNPPSGDQKSMVKKYLKDFRNDPVNAIKKMQQSLRGERMHRDFMDVSTGVKNFRMLYTDMKKREALAVVFPYVSEDAAANFEVRKKAEAAYHQKDMIKNLFVMNDMVFDWSNDLEFNDKWVNPATLTNLTKAQKRERREAQTRSGFTLKENELRSKLEHQEEALGRYILAYQSARKAEKQINQYYKDQITAGIAASGDQFDSRHIHKNYLPTFLFTQELNRDIRFAAEEENCPVKLAGQENAPTVKTHSEKYHAYQYMRLHIRSAIADANYTRYRRERLKKMKAGASLPANVLEKNRQKEELRLRLLENRISDFHALMLLMEAGEFDPNHIEDERLKKLYFHEVAPEARLLQENEAMDAYDILSNNIIVSENKAFGDKKALAVNNDQAEKNDELSVPKSLLNAFNEKESKLAPYRLYLENRARYREELEGRREKWKQEEKQKEAKKLGRDLFGLQQPPGDGLTMEERLRNEIVELSSSRHVRKEGEPLSPKTKVSQTVDAERETLFLTAKGNWAQMNDAQKKAYYYKLLGKQVPKGKADENGCYEEDKWELTKAEEELLLQYFDKDTYWKYREFFDADGKMILPENAPVFSEEEKEGPKYLEVEAIFEKAGAKLQFDENRYYMPEAVEYFENYHAKRQGGMALNGTLSGVVKFNVDRILAKYRQNVQNREEEIRVLKKAEEEKEKQAPRQREYNQEQIEKLDAFEKKMEDALSRLDKEKKEDKKDADGKLITAEDLLWAGEFVKRHGNYLTNNAIVMTSAVQGEVNQVLLRAVETEKKLWTAFDKQYPVVIRETKEDMTKLDALMKTDSPKDALALAEKMEKKLKSLLFGDKKDKRIDQEKEKELKNLISEAGRRRSIIRDELQDNRQTMLKEIDELNENLLMEPGKEQAEQDRLIGVTKEARTLRRASLLVMKCASYLEFDNGKTYSSYDRNLFRRSEDVTRVKNIMKELKKNYHAALGDKLLSKDYSAVMKRAQEIMIKNSRNEGENPLLTEPEIRYRIKYGKAYLILSGFEKKESKTQEQKNEKVENRVNTLAEYVFKGRFTGTESEEDEEKLLQDLRDRYQEVQKIREKLERDMKIAVNTEIANEFMEDKEVSAETETLQELKKQENELFESHEKESQRFQKGLLALGTEYEGLATKIREEEQRLVLIHTCYYGMAKSDQYKAKDPETLKALRKQGDMVRELRTKRTELWNAPGKKLEEMQSIREKILEKRKECENSLHRIIVKKPELFDEDPEKRIETENKAVNELLEARLVMENDHLETVLQKKNQLEEKEIVTFLLKSRGAYILDHADQCLQGVKKGKLKLAEDIRTMYQQFVSDMENYLQDLTEAERRDLTDEFEKKMQDKLMLVQIEVLEQKKAALDKAAKEKVEKLPEVLDQKKEASDTAVKEKVEKLPETLDQKKESSDQAMMEKINELPEDMTADRKMVKKIREIVEERKSRIQAMQTELNHMIPGKEDAYRAFRAYVNQNYESPEMVALKKKIEGPFFRMAKERAEEVSLAIQEIKELDGAERAEKLKKLPALREDLEALNEDMFAITEGIGSIDAAQLLEQTSDKITKMLRIEEKKARRETTGSRTVLDYMQILDELHQQDEFDEADIKEIEAIRKFVSKYLSSTTAKKQLKANPEAREKVAEYERKMKEVTERANQAVDKKKIRDKYRLLTEESAAVVSKRKTLRKEDIKKIKDLQKALSELAGNRAYQDLLDKKVVGMQGLNDALESDINRLEKRLALDATDKTLWAEFTALEKDRKNLDKKKGKADAQKRLTEMDELIARYAQLQNSEEYLSLAAEKIGNTVEETEAVVSELKEEAGHIRCGILDQRYEEIRKKAEPLIKKKGTLNKKDMNVLMKCLEDLQFLSLGETFQKLSDEIPRESEARLLVWNNYIAVVNDQFKRVA